MCEVAVGKGDVGGHARACSRVSRGEYECECNGVQSGRRDTQVCVGCMETTTATVEGQKPGSGGSFIGDRAWFTRQRAGGPCRAPHETPTCSAARVKGLSHLDDLANVCRFIKRFPNTFAHVEYVIRKFCIR